MDEFHLPLRVEVDPSKNLNDLFAERVAGTPDGVLVEHKSQQDGPWIPLTAREFDAEVVAVAKGLVARGVQAGDRVGIMSRTRYEWSLLDWAVWAAGAVPVPLYETSSAEQVLWILTDADVSHPMDLSDPAAGGKDDKDKKDLAPGSARVEISTFDQKKEGDALIVSGKLRNPTQELAENVRLNVIVLDPKGEPIQSGFASLSNGEIESGMEVDFLVKIPVGDKTPATVRFAPTWAGPKPAQPAKGAKPPKIGAPSQAAASNP